MNYHSQASDLRQKEWSMDIHYDGLLVPLSNTLMRCQRLLEHASTPPQIRWVGFAKKGDQTGFLQSKTRVHDSQKIASTIPNIRTQYLDDEEFDGERRQILNQRQLHPVARPILNIKPEDGSESGNTNFLQG